MVNAALFTFAYFITLIVGFHVFEVTIGFEAGVDDLVANDTRALLQISGAESEFIQINRGFFGTVTVIGPTVGIAADGAVCDDTASIFAILSKELIRIVVLMFRAIVSVGTLYDNRIALDDLHHRVIIVVADLVLNFVVILDKLQAAFFACGTVYLMLDAVGVNYRLFIVYHFAVRFKILQGNDLIAELANVIYHVAGTTVLGKVELFSDGVMLVIFSPIFALSANGTGGVHFISVLTGLTEKLVFVLVLVIDVYVLLRIAKETLLALVDGHCLTVFGLTRRLLHCPYVGYEFQTARGAGCRHQFVRNSFFVNVGFGGYVIFTDITVDIHSVKREDLIAYSATVTVNCARATVVGKVDCELLGSVSGGSPVAVVVTIFTRLVHGVAILTVARCGFVGLHILVFIVVAAVLIGENEFFALVDVHGGVLNVLAYGETLDPLHADKYQTAFSADTGGFDSDLVTVGVGDLFVHGSSELAADGGVGDVGEVAAYLATVTADVTSAGGEIRETKAYVIFRFIVVRRGIGGFETANVTELGDLYTVGAAITLELIRIFPIVIAIIMRFGDAQDHLVANANGCGFGQNYLTGGEDFF